MKELEVIIPESKWFRHRGFNRKVSKLRNNLEIQMIQTGVVTRFVGKIFQNSFS